MYMLYVFAIPMKEKLAEKVVQSYLSGIFTHKGDASAILSCNGLEFKNVVLTHACEQLVINKLFK